MKKSFMNPQVSAHKKAFLLQSLLAGIVVLVSLVLVGLTAPMQNILGAVGCSSLASSIFIAFAFSGAPASHPLRMIASYILAIVFGVICFYLGQLLTYHYHQSNFFELTGALAVSLTMFFMILLDVHHPPAAGFALGLVIEDWRIMTLLIIMLVIIGISALKQALKNRLVTLI